MVYQRKIIGDNEGDIKLWYVEDKLFLYDLNELAERYVITGF